MSAVVTYSIQDAAKMLGMGSRKLFALLREQKMLNADNQPYQRYIDQGLFKVQFKHWPHPIVGTKYYGRTVITNKGIERLAKQLDIETTENEPWNSHSATA